MCVCVDAVCLYVEWEKKEEAAGRECESLMLMLMLMVDDDVDDQQFEPLCTTLYVLLLCGHLMAFARHVVGK